MRRCLLIFVICGLGVLTALAQEEETRTSFRIKYVLGDAIYLDGGNNAGLKKGMKLIVKRADPKATGTAAPMEAIAEVTVTNVAEASAICDVLGATTLPQPGDVAFIPQEQVQQAAQQQAVSGARKYPQVVTFTNGNPLEQEKRDRIAMAKPLPEVNRARGRIGFEYGGTTTEGGSAFGSHLFGMSLRADVTRIAGTYWNLSGYWRGRLDSRSANEQETINDLMNRTYHLSMTYANPNSRLVAGFGRLLLPWASSLETLDGGYGGLKLGKGATLGLFAGSTPDPTSWEYAPDRRLAGTFVNFDHGSYDQLRYTSTVGLAVSTLGWKADRQFLFTENGLFYKRLISVYHSLQADKPKTTLAGTDTGSLARSFLTVRVQPLRRLGFDVSHNYFRDLPTFDTRLVSTGLLDKLLFQGFSGGVHVDLPLRTTVYTTIGRTTRSGETRGSLNQMYGVTFNNVLRTGLRADLRYSKFDGNFGSGSYRSFSLWRSLGDRFRWELQGGDQKLASLLTRDTHSKYLMTTVDATFGRHYFIQMGFTTQRGQLQSYDQWFSTVGYRFDNRGPR